MSRAERSAAPSIAVPIFALTIAAVLVATAIFFAITFRGPPPRPAPLPIAAGVETLRHGASPARDGRQLRRRDGAAPTARSGEQPSAERDAVVARALGVPQHALLGFYTEPGGDGRPEIRGGFTIGWLAPGGWRVVATTPEPILTEWHLATLGAVAAALLLLAVPAWIASVLSRPLRRLAAAAADAWIGVPLASVPDGGTREVAMLSRSIAAMHARLTRQAEGRTTMLAAIAHDLGTPLARLAFRIEQLPEEARQRASGDIDEMRAMIGAALRFARDETGVRPQQRLDLGSLLDSLVEDMRVEGGAVELDPGARAIVLGDGAALRRLFGNLIDNAVRYGSAADVSWSLDDEWAAVTVDDRGAGSDLATADALFEPFVRGDPSRSRETGGFGLGLAIVRSLAEAHGGTVTLENQPAGGRVRMALPLTRG